MWNATDYLIIKVEDLVAATSNGQVEQEQRNSYYPAWYRARIPQGDAGGTAEVLVGRHDVWVHGENAMIRVDHHRYGHHGTLTPPSSRPSPSPSPSPQIRETSTTAKDVDAPDKFLPPRVVEIVGYVDTCLGVVVIIGKIMFVGIFTFVLFYYWSN